MSNGPPKTLITAAWVAPMDGPIIRDGAVAFAGGRITAVGPAKSLRQSHPDALVIEAGEAIVLPGLVNAHTHLELSDCRAGEAKKTFPEWALDVRRRVVAEANETSTARAIGNGIEQCIRFGVTAVGDITNAPRLARSLLNASGLRGVSFGEVRGMAQRRDGIAAKLAEAVEAAPGSVRAGVSPHAPYSVEPDGYRACLDAARKNNLPLTTHLAELLYEAEFLSKHSGPLRALWNELGGWDDQVPRFDGGPIRFAAHLGLLDYPTLLAHVNYCDDDELALLARGSASIIYCPRTHRYFGHPPHRWRDMLAAGINVAIGTDSCASSGDLNLVDDLRLAHRDAPDFPVHDLWKMVTVRAAKVLMMDDRAGRLAVGSAADFIIFDATTSQPLRDILEDARRPREVWIDGQRITPRTPAGDSPSA